MKTIKRANKVHFCHICGCDIERGQMYAHESIYLYVNYDYWEDMRTGGYTRIYRNHENRAACELAIQKQKDKAGELILTIK